MYVEVHLLKLVVTLTAFVTFKRERRPVTRVS